VDVVGNFPTQKNVQINKMINLTPTVLVDKFLKSATFGEKYTERTKRLLTIIIIPVWLFGLILCVVSCIDGINGIQNYKIAEGLLQDIPNLEKNSEIVSRHDNRESIHTLFPINIGLYQKLGVNDPQAWDTYLPYRAMSIQKDKIYSLVNIPGILFAFILAPWLLLRLFYWIKKADNGAKI
jgi:uncharacterized membrane protein